MKHLILGLTITGCVALGAYWLMKEPAYAQTGMSKSVARCLVKNLNQARVKGAVNLLYNACKTIGRYN